MKRAIAGLSQKDRLVQAMVGHVKPTHFITLSLCQGRMIVSEHGFKSQLRGDDAIYQKAHEAFIRSLSKRLASRTEWAAHPKPILPNACAIEGGTGGQRYHLHLIVAKPANVSEQRFRMAICSTAAGHPWIMNGNHAVDIQSLADNHEAMQTARYSLKRGVDRICL